MSETRKLAAILVADVVGYSRLAGADEDRILARLRTLRSDLIDPLSEQAYWQVKGRLEMAVIDLGATQLKNIAEPVHVYSLEVGQPAQAKPVNLSADKDQDYFAEGITEDLTTDLSHVFDFVIARNTAFTYRGKPVDAK
jgi:adenylate cyclase